VTFRRSNLLGKAADCFEAKPVLSLPKEPPIAVTSAPGLIEKTLKFRTIFHPFDGAQV
jgi:hypothetical protein